MSWRLEEWVEAVCGGPAPPPPRRRADDETVVGHDDSSGSEPRFGSFLQGVIRGHLVRLPRLGDASHPRQLAPGVSILDRGRNLRTNPGDRVNHDQSTVIVKVPSIDPVFVSLTVIVCVPFFLSFSPVKVCTPLSSALNV